jgi:death-on-curing protein
MMRFLTLIEVLALHRRVIEQSGGAFGIRDIGLLESAIAQPRMMFGGEDLYPGLLEKAVDEQERVVLAIASGELGREAFVEWLQQHTTLAN